MRYKDYIPLPQPESNEETDCYKIVDWVTENAVDPKWSYSRTKSKYYRRADRSRIILGVYLRPEDALTVRLKFNVVDFGK